MGCHSPHPMTMIFVSAFLKASWETEASAVTYWWQDWVCVSYGKCRCEFGMREPRRKNGLQEDKMSECE